MPNPRTLVIQNVSRSLNPAGNGLDICRCLL
jgi:hypothetical protein